MSQFTNNERGVRNQGIAGQGIAGQGIAGQGIAGQGIAGQGGISYGESTASGPARTTAGHHKHDLLNKLDPRVDSTHDHQPMHTNNAPSGTYGPHSSRIANTLDPRVDSQDSRSGGPGAATMHGGAGATGRHAGPMGTTTSGAPEGTYGPHHSRMANAADPRVDSDRDHRGTTGAGFAPSTGAVTGEGYGRDAYSGKPGSLGGQHQTAGYGGTSANPPIAMSGPGPAPNTAGPHRSDLLNKLDPTVDSKAGTGQRRY